MYGPFGGRYGGGGRLAAEPRFNYSTVSSLGEVRRGVCFLIKEMGLEEVRHFPNIHSSTTLAVDCNMLIYRPHPGTDAAYAVYDVKVKGLQ